MKASINANDYITRRAARRRAFAVEILSGLAAVALGVFAPCNALGIAAVAAALAVMTAAGLAVMR